jgi:hypothetical protein
VCPSTALVRDPAEVLPKVAYELGVPALNPVQVFLFKRCILNSNILFRPQSNRPRGTPKRYLTCRKILRHGTSGFTSHPKEDVLRIFIVLKNQSPWSGSNPASFGSSGKHTNHYTTVATVLRP